MTVSYSFQVIVVTLISDFKRTLMILNIAEKEKHIANVSINAIPLAQIFKNGDS